MTRNEAINIIRSHNWATATYFEGKDTDDLIYWAIKIRDGLHKAREWRKSIAT